MNRLVRGSVILAAAVFSWACGGLDTDGADATAKLVADPSVVFVNNTDSQAVFVEALNDLGQQLEGNFTVSDVGPGITVNFDTTFAPRPGVENNPTRVRYFVRGTTTSSFVSSSFTVTANGTNVTIPVNITPANLPGAFSTLTPVVGDTVTFTPAAPLKVTPGTTLTFNGQAAIVTGVAADSSSISFIVPPGTNNVGAVVTGISVSYLSALQTLTTADAITISGGLPGTDDPATAPTVPAPAAVGDTAQFFDSSTAIEQFYTFTPATTGTYRLRLSWPGSGLAPDVDGALLTSGLGLACGAGTAALPETCTATLTAGSSYFVYVLLYDGSAPAYYKIQIIRES